MYQNNFEHFTVYKIAESPIQQNKQNVQQITIRNQI